MQMKDIAELSAKGRILAVWLDTATGAHRLIRERHNIITYQGADVMARLLGGDASYAPRYMGFVYGPSSGTMAEPTDRGGTWETLASDVRTLEGNMLLVPLSNAVAYSVEGGSVDYSGNVATFNAFSNDALTRVFSGTGYLDRQPSYVSGDKYFQAALISGPVPAGSVIPSYRVVARMAVDGVGGVAVDEVFKLAVYWSIAFR